MFFTEKKLKITSLKQMVPINLKQEKEQFFKKKFYYNPQFLYSFERLRFPVILKKKIIILSIKLLILPFFNWPSK